MTKARTTKHSRKGELSPDCEIAGLQSNKQLRKDGHTQEPNPLFIPHPPKGKKEKRKTNTFIQLLATFPFHSNSHLS